MSRFIIHLIAFAVLAVCSLPLRAQNSKMDVQDVILLAEQYSPELARYKNEIASIKADIWAAIGLKGVDVTRSREGIPQGGSGFGEQKWSVSTTIPFPLTAFSARNEIKQRVESRKSIYESERLGLRSSVKKAYTELLYAQEMVHLRQQEVDLASTLVEVVSGRVEVGEAAELERMKVELRRVASQNALQEAQLAFDKRRYEMFRLMGIDPDQQQYTISFPDTMTFQLIPITQAEVMSGITNHPRLNAGIWTEKAAKTSVKTSRYRYLPELKVGYWPQDFGAGYDYYGTEIGFRFTLPFLGQSRTNRIQAKNAVIASQIDNRAITLDLKKRAEFAWHGYETARLAAERFIQKQSEMANRLLQLTREGYQLGELDLLTVLDTQRTYLAVQSGYYRALKDYYLSAINMEELVGRELIFQSKND